MVISLESQNVNIKRKTYKYKKVRKNKKKSNFNIDNFNIKLPQISLNFTNITFVIAFLLFLLIFSSGYFIYIPQSETRLNIKNVSLPENGADIISRNMIIQYESNLKDDYFDKVRIYKGDTISSLSVKYGVTIDTILNYNNISDIKNLLSMDYIVIPKVNGYMHYLKGSDTLDSLSKLYNVEVKDIFRVNSLKSQNIKDMERIFIPYVNPKDYGWKSNISKYFIYPLSGNITRRFGYITNSITGITSLYEGVDFTPFGKDNIIASRGGYISRVGYSANYGNYIYIDHQGGFRTLYAHLDSINVSQFQNVKQGDTIGVVGSSGFTEKRKLFFSIFYKDETVDPEEYLY